jgi:polyhydroxybutyrate depolymerase
MRSPIILLAFALSFSGCPPTISDADATSADAALVEAIAPDARPDATTAVDDAALDTAPGAAAPDDAAALGVVDATLADATPAPLDAAAAEADLDAATVDAGRAGAAPCTLTSGWLALEVDGVSRTAWIDVPLEPGPVPLVLAFHGMGWRASAFRDATRFDTALPGALIVYPQALPDARGMPAWSLGTTGPDIALLDALVARLAEREACIEPGRVVAFGRSLGGYFANTVACARPTLLRALATTIAGGPVVACSVALPVWLSGREDDPTVPFAATLAQRDHWVSADGCAAAGAPGAEPECTVWGACDPGLEVTLCSLPTGGHVPPDWTVARSAAFFARVLR